MISSTIHTTNPKEDRNNTNRIKRTLCNTILALSLTLGGASCKTAQKKPENQEKPKIQYEVEELGRTYLVHNRNCESRNFGEVSDLRKKMDFICFYLNTSTENLNICFETLEGTKLKAEIKDLSYFYSDIYIEISRGQEKSALNSNWRNNEEHREEYTNAIDDVVNHIVNEKRVPFVHYPLSEIKNTLERFVPLNQPAY
jgi:chlorite dismutase